MGLLNKLQQQGSNLTPYDGSTPSTNPLATQQSGLQTYSLNGNNGNTINSFYQEYLDGVTNNLPQPSQLSLGGSNPFPYIYQQPS
jgi:hypothetical protein